MHIEIEDKLFPGLRDRTYTVKFVQVERGATSVYVSTTDGNWEFHSRRGKRYHFYAVKPEFVAFVQACLASDEVGLVQARLATRH